MVEIFGHEVPYTGTGTLGTGKEVLSSSAYEVEWSMRTIPSERVLTVNMDVAWKKKGGRGSFLLLGSQEGAEEIEGPSRIFTPSAIKAK